MQFMNKLGSVNQLLQILKQGKHNLSKKQMYDIQL